MATINVRDLSEELDTSPRVARKFLRSITPVENQPGKGGRWNIEKRDLRSLKKKFLTFAETRMRPEVEDEVDTQD